MSIIFLILDMQIVQLDIICQLYLLKMSSREEASPLTKLDRENYHDVDHERHGSRCVVSSACTISSFDLRLDNVRYTITRLYTMSTVLSISELVWIIASFLPLPANISALSRCNRRLRDITIPSLYRDIEFSVFKVGYLARVLRSNESLPRYCRRLSITLEGHPLDKEKEAYIYKYSTVDDVVNLRKRILSDLEFVICRCSGHGKLTHFSWNLRALDGLYPYWLSNALRSWNDVAMSRTSLQTVQYIIQGGLSQRSLIPYVNALVCRLPPPVIQAFIL